ncbi:MAG: pyruvate dehydrogenase E1 component subunit beta [Parcubacteria group bacterium Gr01-1014_48]|nr:MAG: pyruvate dehydrogenase E1 component subunit beta [Parcubacteria group bacterium Greene0416_14]TSC74623.1 MAG: pyruvate dehydrogenase E1 component subunit beta [Parcubacteria group bacterium Gr01-1014_48]TSD01578.1 MAG: pyruvate dehydrogenase E1 component subunit beta [Parcubacteria group bacterium Greene1014_15]TSD08374.1 MAG: pyruvate dehydrogenase E1 component subunit beta [Parcubacteria group bacterium Greene0714_4]
MSESGGVINVPVHSTRGKGTHTILQAINAALAKAMELDENVVLIGEDVGKNGGVFCVTEGLWERFGDDRIKDTPLSEQAIVATATGASMGGVKIVVEIQFSGFSYSAFEHFVSHTARMRARTLGTLTCPLVVRMPYGNRIHAPEHHSEANEAFFAHIPALKIVVLSTVENAYGLTLAAINDPDPVIVFEPSVLYRSVRGNIVDDGKPMELGKCRVHQEGSDITLITWGSMLYECIDAAALVATENISVEIIDVQTISPLDIDTVVASVKKTGRFAVVQEAPSFCSVASEVTAQLWERISEYIRAPSVRIAGANVGMPLYRRENLVVPNALRIALDIRSIIKVEFPFEMPFAAYAGMRAH